MRNIKDKTQKYLKLKQKRFPNLEERRFVRNFDKAYEKLNDYDKAFFSKVYLKENDNEWWRKYYTKATYYRMRRNVSVKFLNNLELYEY